MTTPGRPSRAAVLWAILAIIVLAAGLQPIVFPPQVPAATAQAPPSIVSITYSGVFNITTSTTSKGSYGGPEDIQITESHQCTMVATFANLTIVGTIVNGTQTMAGVGDSPFSASQSWSLSSTTSGDLQVSINPSSGTPAWQSPGAAFGVLNGSRATFLFLPSQVPSLINVMLTYTHTNSPSLPPVTVPLLEMAPAFDAFYASLYVAIGPFGDNPPSDPSALLSLMLQSGQLSTSTPTQSQDIPFSGQMPSHGSFGGEATVNYRGDLSLTVKSVRYYSASTTTTGGTGPGTTTYTGGPFQSYTLDIKSAPGGTSSPAAGNYTQEAGTSLSVTAIPSQGYSFLGWQLDGRNVGSSNPYSVPFNSDHVLVPIFGSGTATTAKGYTALPTGSWAEYSINVDTGGSGLPDGFPDFSHVVSVKATVTEVSGPSVTVSIELIMDNGTSIGYGQFATDVSTGASTGGFGLFVVSAGLNAGDQLYASTQFGIQSAKINDTVGWDRNGFSLTAVHLKSDAIGEYYWDQRSGLLLSAFLPIYSGESQPPMGSITLTLASTNVFSPGSSGPFDFMQSLSPQSPGFWIVVIGLVAIGVAVVGIAFSLARKRGMRKQKAS